MRFDPNTFALNMFLILGALILLGAAFIVLIATWTGVKVCICIIQRRRAERTWLRVSRRADGKPYPPFVEGICGECRRGGRKIFFPPDSDKTLCPACYEEFWRRAEGQPPSPEVSHPPVVARSESVSTPAGVSKPS